ncbi:Oidioi.mRNA.OKI2018_I69.PAR.g8858.t1.cds [Oikopleura dioica]|uniref:Oidioi.mRNA.OKI2018_I69.PAR.g8858.t1.cds n=1 Tax=Oikopleura dioica TaxID=34765 RepID=A0ABN7RNC5_OIKDI|nr:Oidioi.mRNA.OKI2018_I69.PAR.g8858.t1.cds [Oikopleura dioica]
MGEYIPETANAWRKGYNHLETTTYNRVFLFSSRLFVWCFFFGKIYYSATKYTELAEIIMQQGYYGEHCFRGFSTDAFSQVSWWLSISGLSMVAESDIKRNNNLIREGSPSYAVFVSLKLISLTQVAVLSYELSELLQSVGLENLTSNTVFALTFLRLTFWVICVFHSSYECPLYASAVLLIQFWHQRISYQNIQLALKLIPAAIYLYPAALSAYPFQRFIHEKED